jgi:hypothetical protein
MRKSTKKVLKEIKGLEKSESLKLIIKRYKERFKYKYPNTRELRTLWLSIKQ